MAEELPGGYVTGPVRLGDTVRRRSGAQASFVHRLLQLFEEADWPAAPRFLGFDDAGRETLSYLDGHAAWEARQPAGVTSRASLHRVGELVRQFHELTAGTDLAPDVEDVATTPTLMQVICDGYGLADRSELVPTILWCAALERTGRC